MRCSVSKPSGVPEKRSPGLGAPPVPFSRNPSRREFGAGRTPAPRTRSPVLENRAESFSVSSRRVPNSGTVVKQRARKESTKKKKKKKKKEEKPTNKKKMCR